jgi:hypothetical protein
MLILGEPDLIMQFSIKLDLHGRLSLGYQNSNLLYNLFELSDWAFFMANILLLFKL